MAGPRLYRPPLADEDRWRDRAACRTHTDRTLWDDRIDLPGNGTESFKARAARHVLAQAVCATCPVAQPCADAVVERLDEGVRAGRVLPSLQANGTWKVAQPPGRPPRAKP